ECRDVLAVLRAERGRGARYDVVLADPPYGSWAVQEPALAEAIPAVLAPDGVVAVESDARTEPRLPLALVTSRRYGSARVTLFRHP
ncbi:MAG: RsmD family RNA methyltransferase, partial [Thermoleophilia bacterium]|nr:RsmD family RNA methyltransferase [Thermoleophilia bacterium]